MEQLRRFIDDAHPLHDGAGHYSPRAGDAEAVAQAEVVEQILNRFYRGWEGKREASRQYQWYGHIQLAQRCLSRLEREQEVRQALGDAGPTLDASSLHPWVWDGAKSLWNSGHYREAVEAAAKSLNAFTQTKVGRRDVSEADLFTQSFSDDPPRPGTARLRPIGGNDDSKTAKSLRRGIRNYASGCYAAIRNPKAHEDPSVETPEAEALEQLAALSVLARWVDDAELTVAQSQSGCVSQHATRGCK